MENGTNKKNTKKVLKDFLSMNIAIIIVAVGFYFFMYARGIPAGGLTGLALVINKVLPNFSVGFIMIVVNTILFIIALFIIGKDFGAKSIYCSFALSGVVWFLEYLAPNPEVVSKDYLVIIMIGMSMSSIGAAILFNQNASTGGTDIVAKIINKFTKIEIGKSLLIIDLIVVLSVLFIYNVEVFVYSIISLVIKGTMVDYILYRFNLRKEVRITTEEIAEMKKCILHDIKRGATIYEVEGAFTGNKKYVLKTVVGKREAIKLKEKVFAVDKRAFITVSDVNETIGNGFGDYKSV